MRLLLSIVAPAAGASIRDVAIDCEPDTPIGELAERLARQADVAPAPLWLRGRILDPTATVLSSGLRHGAVVGIGVAVADVLAEPLGLVDVRIVGGRGAGRVRRLAAGSYPLGRGRDSVLELDDPQLPDAAGTIDVTVTGDVYINPDALIIGRTHPAARRRHPLEGPIVLGDAAAEAEPARWRRLLATLSGRRRRRHDRLVAAQDSVNPQDDVALLHLERRPVTTTTLWPAGAVLGLGGLLLDVAPVVAPDASLSVSPAGATLDYNRPPRLQPAPRTSEFSLPTPVKRPDKTPLPMAMILAPAGVGAAMYLVTNSLLSLVFAAMSPVMALSTFTTGRRTNKRNYRQQLAEFHRRDRRVREAALESLLGERARRRHDFADPASILMTASGPRRRLWERRPADPDWLVARLGTADVRSDVMLRDPDREAHEADLAWTAPDVPVTVALGEVGVTGIAGSDELRRSLGRWVLAQAGVLHSPANLQLVLLGAPSRPAERSWEWLRWFPHVRPEADPRSNAPLRIAQDAHGVQTIIRDLLAILTQRRAEAASFSRTPGRADASALLVLLDGARELRMLPGMVSLLQEGPAAGIYFLCLEAETRQLPEECRAVVSVVDAPVDGRVDGVREQLQVSVTGRGDVEGVRADLVDPAWCERLARALAPIRDVSSEDLAGTLPSSSRLLDVVGLPQPRAEQIAAQWRLGGGRTTRAIIGEGLDGAFSLDIRRDGPHGLVAGTTGSGKSELLQTIIASLALGNRPDEMTFVLIDYKGGAAFKDCNRLPHTVGMVTDLDAHLTTRALESLGAELRRREHQLAAAGAKDIEDYQADQANAHTPMARLLIVIDEFAALVGELPDFVAGLVDIARRGRSLGVHLILATQRPAGVVSAEIKSNTNLRIALRVTDANDSQDVIDSSDAAGISKSTPGRAFVRLGASSLVPFQASRVGGRPRMAGQGSGVVVSDFSTRPAARAVAVTADDEENIDVPTDLATLVQAIDEAAKLLDAPPPPSPWLPALADSVSLDDVDALVAVRHAAKDDGQLTPLRFGVEDLPAEQRRAVAEFDLAASGHLGFIGAPRTGRSTALRAIAAAAARSVSPRDLHIYAVDCGNNALLPLVSLPHTGAVVTRDQPERLNRLTSRLLQLISERQQYFAEHGYADLAEQRLGVPPAERMPYLLVMLDRWEGFVSAFDSYDGGRLVAEWLQILQEGTGAGIKVVLSADRSALVGRISALVDDKLVLRLSDPGDFSSIGLTSKNVPDAMPPGRGFRAEGLRETQIALVTADPSGSAQVAALHELGRRATAEAGEIPLSSRPFRVDSLPPRIALAEAKSLVHEPLFTDSGYLPVAVGGDTLTLLGFDALAHGPSLLITGPRRSGRSTALQTLLASAAERDWKCLVYTPRQSPLRDSELPNTRYFTADSSREDVTAAAAELLGAENSAFIVDDLELLGNDGWLADLIAEHVTALRDRPSLVIAAGAADELSGAYRGPIVAIKKSRSGVLLSPQATGDGDLFGVRLPRAALGAASPPGRGLLIRGGAFEGTQVVLP